MRDKIDTKEVIDVVSKRRLKLMNKVVQVLRSNAGEEGAMMTIEDVMRLTWLSYDAARKLCKDISVFFDDVEYENGILYLKKKEEE
ncbi:hypothetical protein J7J18_02645 [bacterium]|nr:hypothetical protein [bacterium]